MTILLATLWIITGIHVHFKSYYGLSDWPVLILFIILGPFWLLLL